MAIVIGQEKNCWEGRNEFIIIYRQYNCVSENKKKITDNQFKLIREVEKIA